MKKIKATLNNHNVKFFCNEEKGVVVCTIESYICFNSPLTVFQHQKVRSVGKAICGKGDKYDEIKGRQIAESRAKVEMYRKIKEAIVAFRNQFLNEEMDLAQQKSRYERLIAKEKLHIEELTQ